MILVTVGTTISAHIKPFDRLVKAMDELAATIDEQVVIQYGASNYKLRYAVGFAWTTSEKMEQLTSEARVIVTQSSAGAIITGLRYAKPMIVVPRLPEYEEVIDYHQQQLANVLSASNKVIAIDQPELEKLQAALMQIDRVRPMSDGPKQLVQALKQIISDWDKSSTGQDTRRPK